MAHRDPHAGPDRLAAVLAPRRVEPWAVAGGGAPDPHPDDAPTLPLPVALPPGRRTGRLSGMADRWLPAAWRNARLDPGRPGGLALLLVAAVAAVLAAVGVWREAPRAEPVADLPELVDTTAAATAAATTAAAAPTGATPAAGPPEQLVVAVAGKVVRPGLVRVPAGSRVADALEAAGGPLPGTDLAGVNLARKVSDGEQVAVGVPAAGDAAPASSTGSTVGTAAPGGPLDLNDATVEQLDALPGVGPVTAQRIVEWRTRNGRFATVDQLREVEGIGERRFGQLRPLVRV